MHIVAQRRELMKGYHKFIPFMNEEELQIIAKALTDVTESMLKRSEED